MENTLLRAIEKLLGEKIHHIQSIQGGDISQAFKVDVTSRSYFLKTNQADFISNFTSEKEGLRLLQKHSTFHCPDIILSGQHQEYSFLILSFIQPGSRTASFWKKFGQKLAELHRVKQDHFGHGNPNYIGALHQANEICTDWPNFFRTQRLSPQVKLAYKQGKLTADDLKRFDTLYTRLDSLLPIEPASLIHGDLWNGNFICSQTQEPYLIDPSVSFAHREMDLAMTRLFGGFDRIFYDSYFSCYPASPGFESRLELLQLYYVLVHVNLFGGQYISQARRILQQYI